MPPKKKIDAVREEITINYTLGPAFAAYADAERLQGAIGIGLTARDALNNLRAEMRKRYPKEQYIVKEKTENAEEWTATGWERPTYDL